MKQSPTSPGGGNVGDSNPDESDQVVQLDGGSLRYQVRGTGRALLYLHPAGDVHRTWPLEPLTERFRVFMPTLPGIEDEQVAPTKPGMEPTARLTHRLGEFIDRAIGERCDVIGQSSGGRLACRLALERPQAIGQLVLLSPLIGADAALPVRHGEIEALTLIVQGSTDRLLTAASVQLLRERIRRSYLVYVYEAGHDIERDQPARLHRLVESFLSRAEAFMVNWGTVTAR